MNVYCGSRSFRSVSLFPLGLLDGLQGVRLRHPCLREVSVGLGVDRLITTFQKNSG